MTASPPELTGAACAVVEATLRGDARLEAQALRIVAALYATLDFSTVTALLAQALASPDPAARLRAAPGVMQAWQSAAASLASPPAEIMPVLQEAVTLGASSTRRLIEVAAPELSLTLPPARELDFMATAQERFRTYWANEPERFRMAVQAVVTEGLQRGANPRQIARELRDATGASKYRAGLIAANEVGNARASAMEGTQRDLGVKRYIWSATNDARTRPEHAARDGKVFEWDKPPSDGHPGQPVRCRCVALPKVDDLISQASGNGNGNGQQPPAPPNPPAPPAPPAPPSAPTASPQGTPVSQALTFDTSLKGAQRAAVQNALAALDRVHGDGMLPSLPVFGNMARVRAEGAFRSTLAGRAVDIRLKPGRKVGTGLTFVHEVGHFLDLSGLGTPGRKFTGQVALQVSSVVGTPLGRAMQAVQLAAHGSARLTELRAGQAAGYLMVQTPRGLQRVRVQAGRFDYWLSPEEVWARAYAQYIAVRSGDAQLATDLAEHFSGKIVNVQWEAQDFEPIARAIDTLLEVAGWRKTNP